MRENEAHASMLPRFVTFNSHSSVWPRVFIYSRHFWQRFFCDIYIPQTLLLVRFCCLKCVQSPVQGPLESLQPMK